MAANKQTWSSQKGQKTCNFRFQYAKSHAIKTDQQEPGEASLYIQFIKHIDTYVPGNIFSLLN